MNATYDSKTRILTVHIPLMATPVPSASGKVMFVAKESGAKFGATDENGKPFVGNVQIWTSK